MRKKNNHQDLRYFKITVFSMVIIIWGIGIGRFFYTLIFPVMLDEGLFTFNPLSFMVSANYGGYLVGSPFFFILQNWEYILCFLRVIWCSHSNKYTYFSSDANNKLLFDCLDPHSYNLWDYCFALCRCRGWCSIR